MLKKLCIGAAAAACLAAALFVGSGFVPRLDMGLVDYAVSDDGTSMTIRADVMSSMGCARACRASAAGESLHLTFYTAFGGLNSAIGAKNVFTIPLAPACTEICIRYSDGYVPVLRKDAETGQWARAA